jgi:hypothetical protein
VRPAAAAHVVGRGLLLRGLLLRTLLDGLLLLRTLLRGLLLRTLLRGLLLRTGCSRLFCALSISWSGLRDGSRQMRHRA